MVGGIFVERLEATIPARSRHLEEVTSSRQTAKSCSLAYTAVARATQARPQARQLLTHADLFHTLPTEPHLVEVGSSVCVIGEAVCRQRYSFERRFDRRGLASSSPRRNGNSR